VLIIERWLLGRLRHRRFYSLAELNTAIGELLRQLNDERPIRRLGVTRRALFEELDRPNPGRRGARRAVRFARDSLLEGNGFELLVPRHERSDFRRTEGGGSGARRYSSFGFSGASHLHGADAD
jgi:hypothetical protein